MRIKTKNLFFVATGLLLASGIIILNFKPLNQSNNNYYSSFMVSQDDNKINKCTEDKYSEQKYGNFYFGPDYICQKIENHFIFWQMTPKNIATNVAYININSMQVFNNDLYDENFYKKIIEGPNDCRKKSSNISECYNLSWKKRRYKYEYINENKLSYISNPSKNINKAAILYIVGGPYVNYFSNMRNEFLINYLLYNNDGKYDTYIPIYRGVNQSDADKGDANIDVAVSQINYLVNIINGKGYKNLCVIGGSLGGDIAAMIDKNQITSTMLINPILYNPGDFLENYYNNVSSSNINEKLDKIRFLRYFGNGNHKSFYDVISEQNYKFDIVLGDHDNRIGIGDAAGINKLRLRSNVEYVGDNAKHEYENIEQFYKYRPYVDNFISKCLSNR